MLFDCVYYAFKCVRTIFGEGGEYLSVKLDSLIREDLDEAAGFVTKGSKSSVEACGPESTEVILLVLEVCKGVESCGVGGCEGYTLLL